MSKAQFVLNILEKLDTDLENFFDFLREGTEITRFNFNDNIYNSIEDVEVLDYKIDFDSFFEYSVGFSIDDKRAKDLIARASKEVAKNKGKYFVVTMLSHYENEKEYFRVKIPILKITPSKKKGVYFDVEFGDGGPA